MVTYAKLTECAGSLTLFSFIAELVINPHLDFGNPEECAFRTGHPSVDLKNVRLRLRYHEAIKIVCLLKMFIFTIIRLALLLIVVAIV